MMMTYRIAMASQHILYAQNNLSANKFHEATKYKETNK